MKSKLLIIIFLLYTTYDVYGQRKKDTLTKRIEYLEEEVAHQKKEFELAERELEVLFKEKQSIQKEEFNTLSAKLKEDTTKLKEDYDLIKKLGYLGLSLNAIFLIGILWKGKKYVQSKINEKFNNIISEKESNIIEIVESYDIEKKILNTKTAVVLTANNEDEDFIKNFFNKVGFKRDNITFKKVGNYESLEEFDLIFVNNDKDKFEMSLIDDYFNNSSNNTVLFYYNTTRKVYNNPSVSDRLSFANSPTQIYGNLINLMKYQQVIS